MFVYLLMCLFILCMLLSTLWWICSSHTSRFLWKFLSKLCSRCQIYRRQIYPWGVGWKKQWTNWFSDDSAPPKYAWNHAHSVCIHILHRIVPSLCFQETTHDRSAWRRRLREAWWSSSRARWRVLDVERLLSKEKQLCASTASPKRCTFQHHVMTGPGRFYMPWLCVFNVYVWISQADICRKSIDQVNQVQSLFSKLWTQCQRCQVSACTRMYMWNMYQNCLSVCAYMRL